MRFGGTLNTGKLKALCSMATTCDTTIRTHLIPVVQLCCLRASTIRIFPKSTIPQSQSI